MTRIQRRIFARGMTVGVLLTIAVIAADLAGALAVSEDWLYDLRARHFQFFTPRPSDQLVHVDIDDRSMESIGAWPWPRAKLAAILDEMRLAGVKAVALDVLFTEPQEKQPITVEQGDGSLKVFGTIDNDAEFAAAVERLGKVIVPASLDFDSSRSSREWQLIVDSLRDNPELTETSLEAKFGPAFQSLIAANFFPARRVAMYERIAQEASGNLTRGQLRNKVLPSHQVDVNSPLTRIFDEQYDRWESATAIKSHAAIAKEINPSPIRAPIKLVPIPSLVRSSAASGFVDFTTDRDGVLRAVPLLVELDGHYIPQLGLSLAMQSLDVQPEELKVTETSIEIPRRGQSSIIIPVEQDYLRKQGREIGLMFRLPWFGGRDWEYMYDFPSRAFPKQHLALARVWQAVAAIRKIVGNNERIADTLPFVCNVLSLPIPILDKSPNAMKSPDWQRPAIERMLKPGAEMLEFINSTPSQDRDQITRDFLVGFQAVRTGHEENQKLAQQLKEDREFLASQLAGKSALIGWTATGMLDMTPTSLHARCPGVVSHGVVFNSIMTGEFWHRGPLWLTILATAILGLLAAAMASSVPPMVALLGTVLIGAAYAVVNGLFLFDRSNMLVGLAGPLGVSAVVWAGCTLSRIVVEASERARITRRFRSYVDPTLVTHVLENPDLVRLEGETRELTVVFTDLAGFTSISERLGHETVPLLNDYMGRMVPIIRAQKGYVNKFLGDGIMFFFGAPVSHSSHAVQAVEAVLEMQRAVEIFNRDLAAKGLPAIGMRAGISSGMMVVGDAGSAEASDYTVLGDTVNLGARLESANKAVGTLVLMNARTAELLDGRFLLRPVGRLQVVGKEQGVMTFEAMCLLSEATESQKRLAEASAKLVDAFKDRKFEECIALAAAMDVEFEPSDLTALYREQCEEYLKTPPPADFDGRIRLTEK